MNANRYKIKANYELFSPHSAIYNPQSNWGGDFMLWIMDGPKGDGLKLRVKNSELSVEISILKPVICN